MTGNKAVTIYHYDENSGSYTPRVFENASVYHGVRTTVKDGGFVDDMFLRIRIATDEDLMIGTDDYSYIGKTNRPIDKTVCNKIVGYGDNRRGVNPHWRIECGQRYRR